MAKNLKNQKFAAMSNPDSKEHYECKTLDEWLIN